MERLNRLYEKLMKEKTLEYSNIEEFENALNRSKGQFQIGENFIIYIDNKKYKGFIESWNTDCLESRNKGTTSCRTIKRAYYNIMRDETNINPKWSNYLPKSSEGEYGVSYFIGN